MITCARNRAVTLLALSLAAAGCGQRPAGQAVEAAGLLDGPAPEHFTRALGEGAIRFPDDHGPHPDYRTEWWYFTGNLHGADSRHFGFELTFFRFALTAEASERSSAWAADQVYMAHFALTDTAGRRHMAVEQLERAALGLAGARARPFRVWLGAWSAESLTEALFPMHLSARSESAAIELELAASKPPVLHGDDGLSRKGPQAGNASWYYSFTRLPAAGQIRLDGKTFTVSGQAWMDREWGTSALGAGVEGWDWFALQLDDGTELMFYRLRRSNGLSDPFSAGSLVAADGGRKALEAGDVVVRETDFWTSPATGITYPSGWRLYLPAHGLALDVTPRLAAQEMALSVRYWEGAVTVAGAGSRGPVRGEGYVELAGYGGGDVAGR